jgi:very-long-chain (3R)-3-hydroxyacyl-CoA dehydratase
MFYPLYPIGIGAEWWLLCRAIDPAAKVHGVIPPIFYFCLMLYIPGKLHVEPRAESKLM